MADDTFGFTVASLRVKADLSQQELATKAHVSVTSIQNWENNRRAPRKAELRRLAEALDVAYDGLKALIEGGGTPVGDLRAELTAMERDRDLLKDEQLSPGTYKVIARALDQEIEQLRARLSALGSDDADTLRESGS